MQKPIVFWTTFKAPSQAAYHEALAALGDCWTWGNQYGSFQFPNRHFRNALSHIFSFSTKE